MSLGETERGCWRPTIELNDPEPKHVLGRLKLSGVKIEVDEESFTRVIESFLDRFQPWCWPFLMGDIAHAIRRELVKPRSVIDVNLFREVDKFLLKQWKEDSSGEEWSDDEEAEYSDLGSEEEEESSSDSEDDNENEADGKTEEAKEEEEMDSFKDDPEKRKICIGDLYFAAEKKGLSVKKGDEEEILDVIIPYIRESISPLNGITIFMNRVSEYMDRCSRLDDLKTMETALQDMMSDDAYEEFKVKKEDTVVDANKDQLSKQSLVPSKEGIATPMDDIKQEEAIATPMNQIKQDGEEKRESENIMEAEETDTSMISVNLPAQPKESMGNAYSCFKESLKRAGGNKRKLAQV